MKKSVKLMAILLAASMAFSMTAWAQETADGASTDGESSAVETVDGESSDSEGESADSEGEAAESDGESAEASGETNQIEAEPHTVSGTAHFADTFAAIEITYDTESWTASAINVVAGIDETLEGTMDWTYMLYDGDADQEIVDAVIALYEEESGLVDTIGIVDIAGAGESEINLRYTDIAWNAEFDFELAGDHIVMGGPVAEGKLVLVDDSTGGFGAALLENGIEALYTSLAGATVTGYATLMTGPTEVTMWYNNAEWTVDLFIADANEYVHLDGIIEDGKLVLENDSSGGFGSSMMDGMQGFYEDCIGGTVSSEVSDVPSDAAADVEVTLPYMLGMEFYGEQIDMNGMDTPDVIIGYNADTWVITYYFNPVGLSVVMHGTIEDGQLVLVEANNPYAGDAETMGLMQTLYENALANGSNMPSSTKDVDFNGMAEYPVQVAGNDTYWAAVYCFEMADKNVLVDGVVEDGQLVIVNDPTGRGADTLEAYQNIYDEK